LCLNASRNEKEGTEERKDPFREHE
jgi:hypothetical protein